MCERERERERETEREIRTFFREMPAHAAKKRKEKLFFGHLTFSESLHVRRISRKDHRERFAS